VSEAKQQLRSAAFFAFGVVGMALLLFFAVRQSPQARKMIAENKAPADAVVASITSSPDFRLWLAKWKAVDAYVGEAEIVRSAESAMSASAATSPQAALLQPPLANRYVWSPNKSKFIDFLASYGEPDSKVVVYNRNGDDQSETLDYCGTPCGFDSAFWLDDSRAVVLGRAEGVKADGSPLCMNGAANEPQKCYSHLTVTVYDFGKNLTRRYVSDNHLFAKDAMAQSVRDRWISGLSPQEREALGEAPTGEAIMIHGRVIDVVAASRIVSIAMDGGSQRLLTLVPTAVIRGVDGAQGPIDLLHKGATVEVAAIRSADGTVTALSARVLTEPAPEKTPTSSPTPKKKSAR
jgi:hypothetical protein